MAASWLNWLLKPIQQLLSTLSKLDKKGFFFIASNSDADSIFRFLDFVVKEARLSSITYCGSSAGGGVVLHRFFACWTPDVPVVIVVDQSLLAVALSLTC